MGTHVIIFLFIFFLPSNGFLFDVTSTQPDGTGSGITDRHYYTLLDMIMEERQARRQLEVYVGSKLQRELQEMKNETEKLQDNFKKLLSDYSNLTFALEKINNETITSLKFKEVQLELNTSQHKLNQRMQEMENRTDQCLHEIRFVETELQAHTSNLQHQLNTSNEQVGFSACEGVPYEVGPVTDRLKFMDLKHSYGITNLTSLNTTGMFTSEKAGLYLVTASIFSRDPDSRFQIVRNKVDFLTPVHVGPLHIGTARYDSSYQTGTGSSVVYLYVNDTIHVQPYHLTNTYTAFNCLTVVKVK